MKQGTSRPTQGTAEQRRSIQMAAHSWLPLAIFRPMLKSRNTARREEFGDLHLLLRVDVQVRWRAAWVRFHSRPHHIHQLPTLTEEQPSIEQQPYFKGYSSRSPAHTRDVLFDISTTAHFATCASRQVSRRYSSTRRRTRTYRRGRQDGRGKIAVVCIFALEGPLATARVQPAQSSGEGQEREDSTTGKYITLTLHSSLL